LASLFPFLTTGAMTIARESSRRFSSSGTMESWLVSRLLMSLDLCQEAASSVSNICSGWPGMMVEIACL
jgi:hypothetical protein